jgi:hypothetical protein
LEGLAQELKEVNEPTATAQDNKDDEENHEHTISFGDNDSLATKEEKGTSVAGSTTMEANNSDTPAASADEDDADVLAAEAELSTTTTTTAAANPSSLQERDDSPSSGTSYDMIPDGGGIEDDDDFGDLEHDDPEMDALEAEIAAALEG